MTSTVQHIEIDNNLFVELRKYQRRLLRVKTRNELMYTHLGFQKGKLQFYTRMIVYILHSHGYKFNSPNGEYELVKMTTELLRNERFFDELNTHDKVIEIIEKVVLATEDLINQMDPFIGFDTGLN